MCLDLSFDTGFSLIILQLRLSSYNGVCMCCLLQASSNTRLRNMISSEALLAATYSALVVDVATLFCWLHLHDSAPPLSVEIYPEVDRRVAVHAAQSASAHASSLLELGLSLVYVIPMSFVPFRYRSTLCAASQCF
jgi:hypothetical protein